MTDYTEQTLELSKDLAELVFRFSDTRVRQGMTVKELAKQAGVKTATIVKMESCLKFPRLDTVVEIAQCLGVKLLVQDVRSVVTCRHCRYKKEATVNANGFLICPASGMEIKDTDFCSYGEKESKDD